MPLTAKEHAERLVDNYTRHGMGDPRESTDHAVATAVAYLDLLAKHDELRRIVAHIDARVVMEAKDECGLGTTICTDWRGVDGCDNDVREM